MDKKIAQLLIVSGIGRNSGKTSLICSLIKQFSAFNAIYAVKISKHWHTTGGDSRVIYESENVLVIEETAAGPKDSMQYLAAGAMRSFYIQTDDKELQKAWQQILSLLPEDAAIICESGTLHHIVPDAIHIRAMGPSLLSNYKNKRLETEHIYTWDKGLEGKLHLENGNWQLSVASC